MSSLSSDTSRVHLIILLIVAAFTSIYFADIRMGFNTQIQAASLEALYNNTADTPFQYRVLVPFIVKSVSQVLPIHPLSIFQSIDAIAFFFLILTLTGLFGRIVSSQNAGFLLALVFCLLLAFSFVLPREAAFYYPWDTAQVLLFSLSIYFLYTGKLLVFFVFFILTTLNKETSCFLILVYALTQYASTDRKTWIVYISLMSAAWMMIKIALFFLFTKNTGAGLFEWTHSGSSDTHLASNLAWIINPGNLGLFFSQMGAYWIIPLIFYRDISDPFFKICLWVVPVYLIGMLFVSNLYEVRVFGELMPIFAASAVILLRDWITQPKENPIV